MLKELSEKEYTAFFPRGSNPFLDNRFIALNRHKVDSVKYLTGDSGKPMIGLVAGVKKESLVSHFSAPFGGFHYSSEDIYIGECETFSSELEKYLSGSGLNHFHIIFPPSLYGSSFNSKMINSMLRNGFSFSTPDLTNRVLLNTVVDKYSRKNSREYYNQAIRNGLEFRKLRSEKEKTDCYMIVSENRARFSRPVHMTAEDLRKIEEIWPVDYFGVFDSEKIMSASAIFYRFRGEVAFAVFWGDSETGRDLRAMDYLLLNLWHYYASESFSFVDLGISTEADGIPNEGLLRFKETHEAQTELRIRLEWNRNN